MDPPRAETSPPEELARTEPDELKVYAVRARGFDDWQMDRSRAAFGEQQEDVEEVFGVHVYGRRGGREGLGGKVGGRAGPPSVAHGRLSFTTHVSVFTLCWL